MIPYGRQMICDDDVEAVVEVLRSNWLTTGPMVESFESAIAKSIGAQHAVAVSSGTAALHAAMYAIGIGPGDEVIVPPMTFVATANCVVYRGGTPVFADVEKDTLLLDAVAVQSRVTSRTKAIIAVDYAGQSCDYDALRKIADHHGLALISDACHAIGAEYKGQKVGSLADATIFSFHPVKHITTGEGGMVVTDNATIAEEMRMFRNHGVSRDSRQREQAGDWFYTMEGLGFNYRLTDFQCALGLSQLKKLPIWLERRREIARRYGDAFDRLEGIQPLSIRPHVLHAYHLYVVRIDPAIIGMDRRTFFSKMRKSGIGVNVHYIPVHLHPYYKEKFGMTSGMCPVAEMAYDRIISLPMFSALCDADVDFVIHTVREVIGGE